MRTTPTPGSRLLCCIPVGEAATALGYFQASLAVVGILALLRETVLVSRRLVINIYNNYDYDTERVVKLDIVEITHMSFALLLLGLALTVAVLLIVGVEKRRAGFVLTYFICGVLAALGLAGYWVWRMQIDPVLFFFECCIEIVLVLCAYSLCLWMVYVVYRNIKLENGHGKMTYDALQVDGADGFKQEKLYSIDLLQDRKF